MEIGIRNPLEEDLIDPFFSKVGGFDFNFTENGGTESFHLMLFISKQGFIQAIQMSGRRVKNLNLVIEFSNTIFIKFCFNAYWC